MKKYSLAIVSERTRYHFQRAFDSFENFEVFHFYKKTFSDLDVSRFKNLISYQNTAELEDKLTRLKPDIVQGLEPYYGYSRLRIPLKVLPILEATRNFCQRTKTPYFFHVLENLPPERKYGYLAGKVMKLIAKRYADGARFIYFLNQGAKNNLVALGQSRKIKYGLWGIWGVDLNEFSPSAHKQKVILFVGRLCAQKGIMDFIDALEQVDLRDFRVKIIGEGSLLEAVEARIKETSLGQKTTILGSVPSHHISKHFAAASFLVAPARSLRYSTEQIGMVNIEAMASGLPVVAYDSGSVGEFINSQSAILIREGDTKALARAIRRLIDDESLRQRMAKAARALAKQRFDGARNAKLLENELVESLKCFKKL